MKAVWYYENDTAKREPAKVVRQHAMGLVDVKVDRGAGMVPTMTSVPLWDGTGTAPTGRHVIRAEADDLPDLDMLDAHAAYRLPEQAPASDEPDGA